MLLRVLWCCCRCCGHGAGAQRPSHAMRGEKGPAALRYCCAAAWGYWPRLLTVCKISLCASLRDVLLWRLAVKQQVKQVKLSSWGEVGGSLQHAMRKAVANTWHHDCQLSSCIILPATTPRRLVLLAQGLEDTPRGTLAGTVAGSS